MHTIAFVLYLLIQQGDMRPLQSFDCTGLKGTHLVVDCNGYGGRTTLFDAPPKPKGSTLELQGPGWEFGLYAGHQCPSCTTVVLQNMEIEKQKAKPPQIQQYCTMTNNPPSHPLKRSDKYCDGWDRWHGEDTDTVWTGDLQTEITPFAPKYWQIACNTKTCSCTSAIEGDLTVVRCDPEWKPDANDPMPHQLVDAQEMRQKIEGYTKAIALLQEQLRECRMPAARPKLATYKKRKRPTQYILHVVRFERNLDSESDGGKR